MGLSTKQVSGDGFDWGHRFLQPGGGLELPKPPPAARRQHQQQQSEPLPCPRCGSTNTKFCYYNNYNRSQPRHFCKACKRHWTKGGTLRNVPVGGGRKNKRPKTATVTAAAVNSSSTVCRASRSNTHIGITIQREQIGDQKKASSESSLYQALIPPPPSSSSQLESIIINTGNFNVKGLSHANRGDFLASTLPNLLHQNQTPPFTFSTLSSFESNPSSMSSSFGSYLSNAYNFTEGLLGPMEEATTTTTVMPTTISIVSQPWQEVPTTSSDMDMANYWNWDDINTLIPTDQLNMHWDDTEIKP